MKFVFGIFAIIIIAVFAVVLLFTRAPRGTSTNVQNVVLTDYIQKNSKVVYANYGEITGDDAFRGVRISVTPNSRLVEVLAGYDKRVIRKKQYINTQNGYAQLLTALSAAGFTSQQSSPYKTEDGRCPFGNRYTYHLFEDGKEISYLWDGTCNEKGTLRGKQDDIGQLFEAQITDYDDVLEDIDI
jgi:hypothetical protein